MTVSRVLWLLVAFAFGCLAMAILLIHPAFANDYCSTYEEVELQAHADGFPFTPIDPDHLAKVTADAESMTGDTYVDVSRGFFVVVPGYVLLGLETHGCLYTPIVMGKSKGAGA